MKSWMVTIVALLVMSLVGVVEAKKPTEGKPVKGQIVSVAADGTSVVVKTAGKKSTEITVSTDAKTQVTIDGTDAKLSDLKKDEYVVITPALGTAEKITATTKKPEKKPKA